MESRLICFADRASAARLLLLLVLLLLLLLVAFLFLNFRGRRPHSLPSDDSVLLGGGGCRLVGSLPGLLLLFEVLLDVNVDVDDGLLASFSFSGVSLVSFGGTAAASRSSSVPSLPRTSGRRGDRDRLFVLRGEAG